MELSPEALKDIRVDSILVKLKLGPETRRGLYVPESARKVLDERRKSLWKAEIVRFGAEIDVRQWNPEKVNIGDTVLVAPEAIDCPGFDDKEGEEIVRYIFIRDEDLIGKECVIEDTEHHQDTKDEYGEAESLKADLVMEASSGN